MGLSVGCLVFRLLGHLQSFGRWALKGGATLPRVATMSSKQDCLPQQILHFCGCEVTGKYLLGTKIGVFSGHLGRLVGKGHWRLSKVSWVRDCLGSDDQGLRGRRRAVLMWSRGPEHHQADLALRPCGFPSCVLSMQSPS